MAKKTQRKAEPEYDNSNTGVLFRNGKKKSDTHPDMRGSFIDADGNEFWLSAWSHDHDKYGKYLSLVATPKEDEPTQKKGNRKGALDDLPF